MVETVRRIADGRAGWWCAAVFAAMVVGLAPFVLEEKWI